MTTLPHLVQRRWAAARPDLDTSPMVLVGLLRRAASLLEAEMVRDLADTPVNPTDLDLLVLLRHAEETVIAKRLAEDLSLTEAAVSRRVAGLERLGLLRRAAHPFDGRSQQIVLTEEGRDLIDDRFPRWLATEQSLLSGLGADGRAGVEQALEALVEVLQGSGSGARH